ncbi:MAG: hypothetical protein ISS26_06340 [Candidatus Omnitrophica bacterium]|nr:hypothetical protein [Candidatus Omnitrophota bacterium]
MLKKIINSLLLVSICLAACGCAEIDPFTAPGEVIRNPLGRENIRVGMSKDEVVSNWSEPDIVNILPAKDAIGSQGEEWVYRARRYTPVPLDSGYLNKNKYLYFDGNNLVAIMDEPRDTSR